jgi:hypothetical protein
MESSKGFRTALPPRHHSERADSGKRYSGEEEYGFRSQASALRFHTESLAKAVPA